jgi:hypothetical protein
MLAAGATLKVHCALELGERGLVNVLGALRALAVNHLLHPDRGDREVTASPRLSFRALPRVPWFFL